MPRTASTVRRAGPFRFGADMQHHRLALFRLGCLAVRKTDRQPERVLAGEVDYLARAFYLQVFGFAELVWPGAEGVFEKLRLAGHGSGFGAGHEGLVDRRGPFVHRGRGEHFQVDGFEHGRGGRQHVGEGLLAFQVPLEPFEGVHPKLLRVFVRPFADVESEFTGRAELLVDPFGFRMHVDYAVERENAVLVGVRNQQGARRD